MARSDRSLTNAHDGLKAARKVSPHHTARPIRSWSLPATTVLKVIFWGVVVLAAAPYVLPLVRGWLS